MISYSKTIRAAALLCTILTAGFAVGQDGVVRMSDRSKQIGTNAGAVPMQSRQSRPQFRQTSLAQETPPAAIQDPYFGGNAPNGGLTIDSGFPTDGGFNSGCAIGSGCGVEPGCAAPGFAAPGCAVPAYTAPGCAVPAYTAPGCAVPECAVPQASCGYCPQTCDNGCGCDCGSDCCACDSMCGSDCGLCASGACGCDSCYSQTDCNNVFSNGRRSGMRGRRNGCDDGRCDCGRCDGGRRDGGRRGRQRNVQGNDTTWFARSVDSGTGYAGRDFYHGNAMSFHNKNARLADKLFGWMVPSGCGGGGCPPVGKYHMTYADQPDYINPNDSQIYAAQGYGMPITVPLAPNVNHQYNYSAGIPASRITTIGNYNPMTSPQRLPHQSW